MHVGASSSNKTVGPFALGFHSPSDNVMEFVLLEQRVEALESKMSALDLLLKKVSALDAKLEALKAQLPPATAQPSGSNSASAHASSQPHGAPY